MIFEEIVELSRYAKQEGADAVIILPPFYFPLGADSLEITTECWRKNCQTSLFISTIFPIVPVMTLRRK